MTGIFYLVFVILRGDTDTLLPLKIMIGILIFTSFSRTLSSCTACLVTNAALIQQVYFPREIFPTAIAGFRFISLILSMTIVIPYMIYEKIQPTATILLLPLAMCLRRATWRMLCSIEPCVAISNSSTGFHSHALLSHACDGTVCLWQHYISGAVRY